MSNDQTSEGSFSIIYDGGQNRTSEVKEPVQADENPSLSSKCADHPSDAASQFCIDCSVFTCAEIAMHYRHKTIGIDEYISRRHALKDQLEDASKIIEKSKASLDAINAILSSLNQTAAKHIQEINKRLDQVIQQVEDIRTKFVTAILREAQTELTKTVSTRERRKYAKYDYRRRVFIIRARNFLQYSRGNLEVAMAMNKTNLAGSTLKVHAPNTAVTLNLSGVTSVSERLMVSLRPTLQELQSKANELTVSESGMNLVLTGGFYSPRKTSFYDPHQKNWTTGQPMIFGRWRHAAVLWNSKVIVAGGKIADGNKRFNETNTVTKSVEQFDPLTNSWTTLPNLVIARCCHALVNLDGSLYVIGGSGRNEKPLCSAERYNEKSKKWKQAFDLQTPRAELAAFTLRNCIYITGGTNVISNALASCEAYHGDGLKSFFVSPLSIGRSCHAAAAHVDTAYVFGGKNEDCKRSPVEQYDWHAEQWTVLNLYTGGLHNNVAASCNGSIYLLGGLNSDSLTSNSLGAMNEHTKMIFAVELPESVAYLAATSVKWTSFKDKTMRLLATCNDIPDIPDDGPIDKDYENIQLTNKTLLVCVGGCDETWQVPKASVYDFACNKWHYIAQANILRPEAVAVTWKNTVVVAGGLSHSMVTDSVEAFDPITYKWTNLPKLLKPRTGHALISLIGVLYVFGGSKKQDQSLKSVEIYDEKERRWEFMNKLLVKRSWFGAAICERRVVLSGGFRNLSCEIYDTERSYLTTIASLNISRWGHASASHNDKVYVFGGYSSFASTCLAGIEYYDADANIWTLLNLRLSQARAELSAACVNGKIYILGGYKNYLPYLSDEVDVFDTSTLQCTTVTHLPAGASYLRVAFLNVTEDQCNNIFIK